MNQNTLILTVLDAYWRRTLIWLEPVVILFAALIMIAPFPLLSDPRPVINATTGGLIAALSLILVSLNLFSGRFKSLPDELSKLRDLLQKPIKWYRRWTNLCVIRQAFLVYGLHWMKS